MTGNAKAREAEKLKYCQAYKDPEYRMGKARLELLTSKLELLGPPGLLLDVGCGRGELLEAAVVKGWAPLGLEVVPELCTPPVYAGRGPFPRPRVAAFEGVHRIPFGIDSLDAVVCADVLEHCTPLDGDLGLAELVRVCRGRLLITTAWTPHEFQGMQLHVNCRPLEYWVSQLERYGSSIVEAGKEPGAWGYIVAEARGPCRV